MSASEPYRLHESIGYLLSLVSRQQERRLDDGLKQIGLTRATWCIILGIHDENLSQPSELADFVGIDRTAASRALRQLEADGMILRSSGTGDRRTRTVELTEAGEAVYHRAVPLARENAAILSGRLSEDEVDRLREMLRKLSTGEAALRQL